MTVASGQRIYQYIGPVPFRVDQNFNTAMSGILFAQSAFCALSDRRLFDTISWPTTPFKLYINRDTNNFITIEPDPSGILYTTNSGCLQYSTYITDMRTAMESTWSVTANDSEHVANQFKRDHLIRQHSVYPDNIRASGGNTYARPDLPITINHFPSGIQIGTSGIYDIDIAECQWTPFPRPKNLATKAIISDTIPIEPIFPMVVKTNGSQPDVNDDSQIQYQQLGINLFPSGGAFLVIGDALTSNSFLALLNASGASSSATAAFYSGIAGAQYPGIAKLSPSGRQAIYQAFNTTLSEGVYLLAINTNPTSSGTVSHYPAQYASTSGFTNSPIWNNIGQLLQPLTKGIYVADKLIFPLFDGGDYSAGRSLQTGRRIYGYLIDNTANSRGSTYGGIKFQSFDKVVASNITYYNSSVVAVFTWSGGTIYAFRGKITWGVLDNTLSNITFLEVTDDANPGSPQNIFFEDISAGNLLSFGSQCIVRVFHNIYVPGLSYFSVIIGVGDSDVTAAESYTYVIDTWDAVNMMAVPGPTQTTYIGVTRNVFSDAGGMWNSARVNQGRLATVGGDVYINFNGRQFRKLRAGYKSVPASLTPSPWQWDPSIGKYWRYRPTSQVTNVPDSMLNAGENAITLPSWSPFTTNDVDGVTGWGNVIYDWDTGKNYLYVQLKSIYTGWRWWFMEMDNSFNITKMVPVEAGDTILNAKGAILDL